MNATPPMPTSPPKKPRTTAIATARGRFTVSRDAGWSSVRSGSRSMTAPAKASPANRRRRTRCSTPRDTTTSPTASASLAARPDVKVGLATSKTGAANFYNPQQTNGAQLAVDQFNATGGFQGGRQKIQLIVEDDGSTKDQGITVFKKFVEQDKVAAILGPTLSAVAAGAHPVAQASGTPVIAISNTGLGIVGKCDYGPCDWIFRASLGEQSAVPETVKAATTKLGIKKVVIIYGDGKFELDDLGIFRDAFKANGVTVAKEIPYRATDVDF